MTDPRRPDPHPSDPMEAALRAGLADLASQPAALPTRLDDVDASLARRRTRLEHRRRILVGAAASGIVVAGGGVSWALGRAEGRRPRAVRVTGTDPTPTTAVRPLDAWRRISSAPLSPRTDPAVIWIGDRMVVWSGNVTPGPPLHSFDGAIWDPNTNAWTPMSGARAGLVAGGFAVWDGTELVVGPTESDSQAPWNIDVSEETARDGIAAYDPIADRWRYVGPFGPEPGSALGSSFQAVVVGSEIVIAPEPVTPAGAGHEGDVMALDVRTGERRLLPPGPFAASPYDDSSGSVSLTGVGELLVATPNWDQQPWVLETSGSWSREAAPLNLDSLHFLPATSIGVDAIFFASDVDQSFALDPSRAGPFAWRRLPANPFPRARWNYEPVWSGRELFVPGAAYDPQADRWREVPPPPRGPDRQRTLRSLWTGDALVLFGGEEYSCPDDAVCDRNPGTDFLDGWMLAPE